VCAIKVVIHLGKEDDRVNVIAKIQRNGNCKHLFETIFGSRRMKKPRSEHFFWLFFGLKYFRQYYNLATRCRSSKASLKFMGEIFLVNSIAKYTLKYPAIAGPTRKVSMILQSCSSLNSN
jgi:hypothetical protein